MSFQLSLDTEILQHIRTSVPIYAQPDTPVRQVLAEMRSLRKGSVLVCDAGRLMGIFTERDALKVMAGTISMDTPIHELMMPEPVTVSVADTVQTAIQLMSSGGYRRLAILNEDGVPVAIIKATNILRYLVEHFPQAIYNLPPAPHHSTQEREGA